MSLKPEKPTPANARRNARSFLGEIPGYAALAVAVGVVAAIAEFALGTWSPPGGRLSWSFFLGDAALIYGVQGPWQYLAHKAFAYGWAVPACAALISLGVWPLLRLFRRAQAAPKLGLSVTAALIACAQAAIPITYILKSPRAMVGGVSSRQSPIILILLPIAVVAFSALFYLLLSTPAVKRLRSWRRAPAAAMAVFAVAAAASFWPAWDSRPPAQGPNVLIITIDALRADKVGPGADGQTLTPRVDEFAKTATSFARCNVSAPWTLPSLATLLTGLEPPAHGADWSAPLAPGYYTLAEAFYDAGYETAGVGGNNICEPRFGLAQGFSYYRTMEMFPGGLATRLYYILPSAVIRSQSRRTLGTTPAVERYAVEFLRERKSARGERRPFFMWVHFLDPHDPYSPPPAWTAPDVAAYRLNDNLDNAAARDREIAEARYDAEIKYVDDAVGRILATLDDVSPRDNTVVVISSDHGEEFWDHGWWGHGHTFYDELTTVPLIMRAPGVWPAGRDARAVAELDLPATLAEICYVTTFESPQSRSFVSGPGRRFSFCTGLPRHELVALAEGNYKLAPSPKTGAPDLYDLATDAGETTPISDDWRRARYLEAIEGWWRANAEVRAALAVTPVGSSAVERDLRALGYIK